MVETAEHLADHVFPRVPVRQWVLSFPWLLRVLFAARPEVLTRVLNVVARAVFSALLKRARLTALARRYVGRIAQFALDEVGDFAMRQRAKCHMYKYHLNVI